MTNLFKFLSFCMWVFGIVLAKGFWSTFFAVIFPLWAWYLAIEFLAHKYMGVM